MIPQPDSNVSIEFGAMADPLMKQFEAQGVTTLTAENKKDIRHFQKDADAITRCSVRGLISSGQASRSRQRLAQRMMKAIR